MSTRKEIIAQVQKFNSNFCIKGYSKLNKTQLMNRLQKAVENAGLTNQEALPYMIKMAKKSTSKKRVAKKTGAKKQKALTSQNVVDLYYSDVPANASNKWYKDKVAQLSKYLIKIGFYDNMDQIKESFRANDTDQKKYDILEEEAFGRARQDLGLDDEYED